VIVVGRRQSSPISKPRERSEGDAAENEVNDSGFEYTVATGHESGLLPWSAFSGG